LKEIKLKNFSTGVFAKESFHTFVREGFGWNTIIRFDCLKIRFLSNFGKKGRKQDKHQISNL